MPRGWSGGALSRQRPVKPNKRLRLAGVRRVALRIRFAADGSSAVITDREASGCDRRHPIRCDGNSGSVTLCTEPRATLSRPSISAGALILTTLLLRILCLTNRMRPSWHGSGKFLGGAPVLSSFGTRETTTAAPMNQNYTLASRPADQPEAGPCSRAAPSLARSS